MKFYKRFPGDIMKKTSGLTMAQFGAYDRLIDWCYANEKPVDPDEVYTITHAQTPADRRDVDKVLAKFFTKDAEGYRQERVEEVIAEALPKIEAARENGKKGGRPKKQTNQEPTGLFQETQSEPEAKTIQSQTSSLRSEEGGSRKRSPSFKAEGIELPDWLDREVWEGWCKERRARGKPITERAAKEQLSSLDEYRRNGHAPARVISHAIASGNQGLYPPPVIRGAGGVANAAEPKVVEVWKAPPPLTAEERAASQVAKERALSAIKIIKASA